jgi:hypothetical protein
MERGEWSVTHGHSRGGVRSKTLRIYRNMLTRCYNQKFCQWADYGGRGIKVANRWLGESGFANFLSDMGECPSDKHSLDRHPNGDGNYEPENCRWATAKEQCNNKKTNVSLTIEGITQTVKQWAEASGVSEFTIYSRVKAGWSDYDCVYGKRHSKTKGK